MTKSFPSRLPAVLLTLPLLAGGASPSAALQAPPTSAPAAAAAAPLPSDPVALYREGLKAREAKDSARYLAAFVALRERWPDDPDYLYRHASALSQAGRPAEALPLLRRVVAMGVVYDIEGESDLASFRALPEYEPLRLAMEGVRARRVANATVLFRLDDRGLFPEGVAWDPETGDTFVSAQPERKIVRVSGKGKGEASDFIASAQDGIGMVMGIRVDAPRRLLWAVSSAEPMMRGYAEAQAGETGLFAFDLATGKLQRKVWLPKSAEPQNLDDLTVAADGRVYASEPGRGAIYSVAPGSGALETVIAPGGISYPNGLAVTPDGKRLYASDYSTGIFAIDLPGGRPVAVRHAPDLAANGIDGLVYRATAAGGSLYAIQNGVAPARVLRLDLSADGLEIAKATILEMNTAEMEEPTLGVFAGDRFCFVANSHDGKLRAKGGPPKPETLSPPTVLCVKG